MPTAELTGITIVGNGTFNPAIVHPLWLAQKGLIPLDAAEYATQPIEGRQMVVSPQIASFVADWLVVQITQLQAIVSTVDQGREKDLRDFAIGLFRLLPETPVDAIGINSDSHIRTESVEKWHALGDRFVPKEFWESLFTGGDWKPRPDGKLVGMRVMAVEVAREDQSAPGHVRIELAPSLRIAPPGVYLGVNSHFTLTDGARRANAEDAARVLAKHWVSTRELELRLLQAVLEEL